VAVNQVLYNLDRRSIERRILPWCLRREILIMAYSPLEQGRLEAKRTLEEVAARHGATPCQIALVWTLRHENVVAIVKASLPEHVRQNAASLGLSLTDQDLAELDRVYPAPTRDVPLDML
jgi:diketogulonate reductase-like aldo/keto reductase